jgi:hypothetical protein
MPILCQTAAPAGSGPTHHPSVMALHHVGSRAVGPFCTTPGGYKHILVAVDKFTKWIEVRPVAKVTLEEATKFIGDITRRFGVPNRIITDLGKAFTGSAFWDFCQEKLSMSTTPRSPTLGATARSNVPMAWSFRPSKTASTMMPPTTPPGG